MKQDAGTRGFFEEVFTHPQEKEQMPASSVHTNASTTVRQREAIRIAKLGGQINIPALSASLCTSRSTVYKWAKRNSPGDLVSGRKKGAGVFGWTEDLLDAIDFFRSYRLSAHDVVEALRLDEELLIPSAATIHRKWVKDGTSRLPSDTVEKPVHLFQEAPLGYLHIDLFYLPDIFGRRRFCMVVIERMSRLIYAEIIADRLEETVTKAFGRALDFYPCKIHTVLSDNGAEFGMKGRQNHQDMGLFDSLCHSRDIKHKRTRPATPQTNGMVERMNGQIKQGTGLAKSETWQILVPTPSFTDLFEAERTKTILPSHQSIPTPVVDHLKLWVAFWNEVKPHRLLRGQTPLAKLQALYLSEPSSFWRSPLPTIKDLDRLNQNLGGQRLSFICSKPPLKKALLSTS